MGDFGIRYFNEVNFVTDWMTDTPEGLELLRDKANTIAQDLLKFIFAIDEDIKGVHINYYYADSDAEENVTKWSVTLTPRYEHGFTEELRGNHPDLKLELETKKEDEGINMGDKNTKKVEMVMIPRDKYNRLIQDSDFLSCLEVYGVDSWDGYGDACEMMQEE